MEEVFDTFSNPHFHVAFEGYHVDTIASHFYRLVVVGIIVLMLRQFGDGAAGAGVAVRVN